MISKIRPFLFFLVISCLHLNLVFSQIPTIDALPLNYNIEDLKDSSSLNFSDYRRNFAMRKIGYYDNLISRFNYQSFNTLDFDFGIPSFYGYTHQKFIYGKLDTLKAISNLQFVLGTKREQLLFLDHKQRLGKYLTAAFSYHSLVTEGFYKHSFAKSKAINGEIEYSSSNYSFLVFANFNNLESNEYGGIITEKQLNGLSKNELVQFAVNLPSDSRKNKRNFYGIKQNLNLFNLRNDSLRKDQLLLNFDILLDKTAFNYRGVVGDYYQNSFLDSVNTNDTLGYINLTSLVQLKYLNITKWNKFEFNIGFERNDLDLLIDTLTPEFFDYTFKVNSDFQSKKFKAYLNSSLIFGDSYRSEQTIQNLFVQYNVNDKILSEIYGAVSYNRTAAPYTYLSFVSNNFIWNNNYNKLAAKTGANLGVSLFKNFVRINFATNSYENRYFVSTSAIPEQSIKIEQLSSIELEINKSFGKIYFTSISCYSKSNSIYFPVPELRNETSISFRNKFFKQALNAEIGLTGVYTSSWFAPAYMPATGLFYLQNSLKVEGAPVLHFFANLGIKSATIFIRVERLNYGVLGSEYYYAPGYAAPPRTLKFGVFWRLKN